jgi:DNA-binding IclR family transcriptional regulator
MLAYLSDHEIDRIYPDETLPRYTANTIATKADLKRELARIQTLGYAFDDGESGAGVWAVAACIRYRDGSPLAATSIIVPFIRVTEERRAEWHRLITQAAEEISTKLGIKAVQVEAFPRG